MDKKLENIIAAIDKLDFPDREFIRIRIKQNTINFISELNEKVQKQYKVGIKKIVTGVSPKGVQVAIGTPYGTYAGIGQNKIEAFQVAAYLALTEFKTDSIK